MLSTSTAISTTWQTYGSISASLTRGTVIANKKQTDTNVTNETTITTKLVAAVDRKANLLRFANIALLSLVLCGFGMCGSLFAPFFPTEAARRGVSATMVGLIFSSFTVVMFIGSLASGLMMRTLGLHFMIWAGTLLAGGSTVLFGLLDQAPPGDEYVLLCFLVRLVEGAGGSLYNTAAFSIVAELYPQHLAISYAVLEASGGVGRMVGPSLGGVLFSAGGFSLPFYVVGCILLVFGFISQATLRYTMPAETNNPSDKNTSLKQSSSGNNVKTKPLPWSHFYRVSPDIWILTITMSSASILVGFPQPTIALYFAELGLTDSVTIGLIFLAVSVVYMISAIAAGKIADSFPNRCYQMLAFGSILCCAAYIVSGPAPFMTAFVTPSVALTSSGYAFAAFAIAAIISPAPQVIIEAAHAAGYKDGLDTSAMVASLYNAMWFLGSFAGAPIAGFLSDMVGFQWGAFIMAMVAFLMTLLVLTRELLNKCGILQTKKLFNYSLFQEEAGQESIV